MAEFLCALLWLSCPAPIAASADLAALPQVQVEPIEVIGSRYPYKLTVTLQEGLDKKTCLIWKERFATDYREARCER